jgi:uncharacterized protein YlxP (DUF503 family)
VLIGVMEIDFRLFGAFSLKDKRRFVKSLIDKTRKLFNVSIAEVDNNETVNFATIGYSCVSNSSRFIEQVLDRILEFNKANYDMEMVSVRKEIL